MTHHSTSPSSSPTPLLDGIDTPADLKRLDRCELATLADELRTETIAVVSSTGGHLGASLGVIELTVALHATFDAPADKIIFDVGHQCYPHKILTGRRDRIRTLRRGGGLSGFTRRGESAFDPFGAAHSSTSISAGFGFAVARDLSGRDNHVVCLIGDGALSAGMAYEGLNNAGASGRRMIVILNDNQMSIAPPVGAMSTYLKGLAEENAPSPASTFFGQIGFTYLGPIDGHDMNAVLDALEEAKAVTDGPVLIHALTVKGKGYPPAEASADKYHGVAAFDIATGQQAKGTPRAPAYTKVFASALIAAAERDDRIVAVTAAMPDGTGIDQFARRFPERAFDVGIAEQHAVTFCAGLAADGMKPVCAIYSTFLQRGYDQIVHDVALQQLPVRFAIDRAGLVGADGPTHAGAFDIGYLSNLPGFTIMAPGDEADLVHMVATMLDIDDGPSAVRFPRGEGIGVALPERGRPLPIGKGRIMREGTLIAILNFGGRLSECLAAAEMLTMRGLSTTVADARFAKPLDEALIDRLVREHEMLITVEEGARGGFGAHVLHYLAANGTLDRGKSVRTLTLPDRFIQQDTPDAMYAEAGLDRLAIIAAIDQMLCRAVDAETSANLVRLGRLN